MLPSRFLLTPAAIAALVCGCGPREPLPPEESIPLPGSGSVVIYVEAPHSIAGPILKSFSEQTGVEVRALYRETLGEAFLTRVEADVAAGTADLLWATNPLPAMELARQDLAVPCRPVEVRPIPTQYRDQGFRWIGFAVNPRVLIYNSTLVKPEEAPQSIDDMVRPPWGGKGAVSRTREGSAAFAAAAMFALRGAERARAFFEQVAAGGNLIAEDEAAVPSLVASGKALWGVTDLDVAILANRQGAPLHITYPRATLEAFVVPHVVALLRRAPHLDQAKGLLAYLLSTDAAYQLSRNDRALITLRPGVPKPDWLPGLAAFNVTQLDNQKVFEARRANAAFLASWGAAAERIACALTAPTVR